MIFTIDNDNDIRVHETEAQAEEAAKAATGTIVVRSEKELNKAAAEWPASRPVELWNSFAGVAPFTDCKPVKKFAARDKAVARIWTTIQRLGNGIALKPPVEANPAAETKKGGKSKAAKSAKPAPKAKATKGKKAVAGSFTFPNVEFRMTQRSVACINAAEISTLNDLLIALDRFRKFLSLAVGAPVEVTMLRSRATADPTQGYFQIHNQQVRHEEAPSALRPDEMIFDLNSVRERLPELLQRWEQNEVRLRPIYNLYTGTIASTGMYIEHQYTSFFQAVESYHRRTAPLPAAKPGKKPARISAKERLAAVIKQCAAEWLFAQPLDAALKSMVDVRDYFTHYLPDRDQLVLDTVELYNNTVRLRLLLEMALLQELGMDQSTIKAIFTQSRRLERSLATKA